MLPVRAVVARGKAAMALTLLAVLLVVGPLAGTARVVRGDGAGRRPAPRSRHDAWCTGPGGAAPCACR